MPTQSSRQDILWARLPKPKALRPCGAVTARLIERPCDGCGARAARLTRRTGAQNAAVRAGRARVVPDRLSFRGIDRTAARPADTIAPRRNENRELEAKG